jgi:hypothetical protein
MTPMRAQGVAAAPAWRSWWMALVAGGAIGLAIFLVTQILSETRIAFGPWALSGNGALAMPFVGFPLAIYAGWTYLADRHAGRDLALRLASYSLGLVVGAGVFGLFFGLPMVLVTGAIYGVWARGAAVRKSDRLLWVAFAISAIIGALVPLFGAAFLPGSLILLGRGKSRRARIALGALLVAVTVASIFGIPAILLGGRAG